MGDKWWLHWLYSVGFEETLPDGTYHAFYSADGWRQKLEAIKARGPKLGARLQRKKHLLK